MIHEIGLELKEALKAQGCPIDVVDGPERTKTTTFGRERIVLEYAGTDSFGPPRGARANPKQRMTCAQGMQITIYAQHPGRNAVEFEHRRRAAHVRDLVLVALGDVAKARHNEYSPKSGRFLVADDLVGTEVIAGAVYELIFSFDRAVLVQTWTGASQPEATLAPGSIHNTTKVSRAGGPNEPFPGDPPVGAETSCTD